MQAPEPAPSTRFSFGPPKSVEPAALPSADSRLNRSGTEDGAPVARRRPREYVRDFDPPLSLHFGRQELLDDLVQLARSASTSVVCIHAGEGEGKSALLFRLHACLAADSVPYGGADAFLYWRFTGTAAGVMPGDNLSDFFDRAIGTVGNVTPPRESDDFARMASLVDALNENRSILFLEGFGSLQNPGDSPAISSPVIRGLVASVARLGLRRGGLIVITSTKSVEELEHFEFGRNVPLPPLGLKDCVALLRSSGAKGGTTALEALARRHDLYPLALVLLGREMRKRGLHATDVLGRSDELAQSERLDAVFEYYDRAYRTGSPEETALYLLSLFQRPASWDTVQQVLVAANECEELCPIGESDWDGVCASLEDRGFGVRNGTRWTYGLAPRVFSEHTARRFSALRKRSFQHCNSALARAYESQFQDPADPRLIDLEPMYNQAHHLCLAGRYSDALDVYWAKICRERVFYTQKVLGAYSNDLQLLSAFYRWGSWETQPNIGLSDEDLAWLLAVTAYLLNVVGLLHESELLRTREIQLHESMENYLIAAQDLAHLGTTQLFQCKLGAAMASLSRARDLLESGSGRGAAPSSRYASALDPVDVERVTAGRQTLATYYVAPRVEACQQARSGALDFARTSDGFYAFLTILDGLAKHPDYAMSKNEYDEVVSLVRSYRNRSRGAAPAYELVYVHAVQALVTWRGGGSYADTRTSLVAARDALAVSGRLDIAPLILSLSLQITTAYAGRRDASTALADAVALERELQLAVQIHHADLFEIEAWILRARLLILRGEVSEAEQCVASLQADYRVTSHWRSQIDELVAGLEAVRRRA